MALEKTKIKETQKKKEREKKKTLMNGKEEQPKSLIYKYKNLYTKKTDFTRKKKNQKKTQKRTKKKTKKDQKKRGLMLVNAGFGLRVVLIFVKVEC